MLRLFIITIISILFTLSNVGAQEITFKRLEPSSWWIGMKNPELMLMVYGNQIATCEPQFNIQGIELKEVRRTSNPNYMFIFVIINELSRPGDYPIRFVKKGKVVAKATFTLYERDKNSALRKGFNTTDAIYLLMPDRFANGDTTNDNVIGMVEKANRKAPYGRHGGDIKGIIDHLDYIQSLGMTALWTTPVLENNQKEGSYHGYAITDYYRVDPRLGTNADFRILSEQLHQRGMKLIMDMVFNHCGSEHWWMNDLPSADWIHQFPTYTGSNYRPSAMSDIHAAKADAFKNTHGWFVPSMPDMNLSNELVFKYLVQNSIWWVEYANLDGIRMDTHPYPEKEAMAEWLKWLFSEYPNFNVVGEVWITSNAKLAYWQKDACNRDGFNSNLPTLMDFPLTEAIQRAFNEDDGYDTGLSRIYNSIADDFLFPYPDNKVVFAENHDWARIFEYVGKDIRKMKLAITVVATTRGIPQFYYGSELLMTGDGWRGHSEIRHDFPGGWPKDSINAFTADGRTADQNEMVNYISRLFKFRHSSKALTNGQLIHFIPENNLYIYFRIADDDAVMVVINNHPTESRTLDVNRMTEILQHFKKGKDIFSGDEILDFSGMSVPAKSAVVMQLFQ